MNRTLLAMLMVTTAASAAHAQSRPFYTGANHLQPLPNSVVPGRYYAPTYGAAPTYNNIAPAAAAPAPLAPLPTPQPVAYTPPAPAYVAPAPAYTPPPTYTPPPAQTYAAPAPAYTYAAPAPAYQPAPVAYATPAPTQPSSFERYYEPAAQGAKRPNQYYIGVDSYYDSYKEDSVDLHDQGLFASLEYGYSHYFTPNWYMSADGRASYGRASYSSISGEIAQIPSFELDHSLIAGYDMNYGGGRHFKPYGGLGLRYFNEKGKGEITDLGFVGYDRRFWQLYMPVGLAMEMPAFGNYTAAPLVEFAPLLYGYGESRFQNISRQKLSHVQHNGYRFRTELMFRKMNANGSGFEFGPFLRYWAVDDSELDTNGSVFPSYYVEPENTRLQAGFSAKWLF